MKANGSFYANELINLFPMHFQLQKVTTQQTETLFYFTQRKLNRVSEVIDSLF